MITDEMKKLLKNYEALGFAKAINRLESAEGYQSVSVLGLRELFRIEYPNHTDLLQPLAEKRNDTKSSVHAHQEG